MIYALIMTPAILKLIAYAPLPNGGGINYVLICLSTDNVTERLFQRALRTKTSGFLPGDYLGANPAGVKVAL